MSQIQSTHPYQKIGIDKIQFSNIAVVNMDIPHLLASEKITIQQASNTARPCRRYLPNGTGITKITIKDNEIFSELIIGCASASNGIPLEYVYLSMVIPDVAGNNLVPWCYTDYDDYLHSVFDYIAKEYHIALFWGDMKINYMEINCNIPLADKFSKYSRSVLLLMSLMNNHMGKLSTYNALSSKNGNKSSHGESFKRGNKSVEVIIYDKLQELIDTGQNYDNLDTPILRIEYRLKNRKKIKEVFGSNFWKDLDDKKIAEFFIGQIRTQLGEKYECWKRQQFIRLKRMIKNCRHSSTKNWHHLLMQEIRNQSEQSDLPFILDIEQVYEAVYSFPDKNARRKCEAIASIDIKDDVYKNHDTDKVCEILTGAELSYKNTVELFYGAQV